MPAPPGTAEPPAAPAELIVRNPATEEIIATIPAATAQDVHEAVTRAAVAQRAWAGLAPGDRARLLRRFAAVVDAHLEELALLEVREAGHLIGNARWEAGNVRDLLDYAAGGVERLTGRQIPVPGGLDVTLLEPLGVVGVIAPWNFPMPIAAWGTAPALAAGNAVVLKPAETTPLTALRIAELALEAGLPEHLLQVLPGTGSVAGGALVEHPGVAKIVFTGSTRVGKQIMAQCAEQVKRLTLELGGKSPNIVFADADVEQAAATAPMAFLDNAGQDCCARTRILVQSSVLDRFLDLLAPAVAAVTVGDPRDPATGMGPLISRAQLERVRGYLPSHAAAIRGSAPQGPGYWCEPIVLTDADPASPVAVEEVFGPVAVVLPFEDEADAIRLANDTPYGLSGSIWTRDVGRALRMSAAVAAGNLSVNSHASVRYWTPFGGYRQSGLGRELGPDALAAFTETKNVFIATGTPANTTTPDTDTADTTTPDTTTADTGTADTGTADTGTADTGTADTGTADTGTADTGTADTGTPADVTPANTHATITGIPDAGTPTPGTPGTPGAPVAEAPPAPRAVHPGAVDPHPTEA